MQINFLAFDGVTQLDMTGPLQVLSRMPGATVSVVAETRTPVMTDCGFAIVPTHDFSGAPDPDMIVVPGGFGVVPALGNSQFMTFLRESASTATYVTSVCTGALLLGGARLLEGRKATTHWAYTDLLSMFGAILAPGRVVRDGNVITGGGVTAGIDFGLSLVSELSGQQTAEAIQLAMEYNPQPPVNTGHPDQASQKLLAEMQRRYEDPVDRAKSALKAVLDS